MAELQITDMPVKAAPNDRKTKQSERFALLAVNATFDGAAAVTPFLPCVEILSDSGAVVSRTFAGSVAAGASAEVTFAPFLRDPNAGGGIQFDTDPQTGGYLHVETTAWDPSDPNFAGVGLYTVGGNPVVLGTEDNGWIQLMFNEDGSGGAEREIRMTDTRIGLSTVRTGIDMFDAIIAGNELIDIATTNNFLTLTEQFGLRYRMRSTCAFNVATSVDNYFTVSDDGANHGTVDVGAGKFTVSTRFPHTVFFKVEDVAGTKTIDATTDTMTIKLKAGGKLEVQDSGGNPIFRVNENGDLQGLTGKALTFNL